MSIQIRGCKIKIIHVVPTVNQEAAGPSYSVPRLCESILNAGGEVRLKCLSEGLPAIGVELIKYPQVNLICPKFGISYSLAMSLFKDSKVVDIIHNHSLWSMINIASGFAVPGRKAKYIISPRGTLSSWALSHSRIKKAVFGPAQRYALRKADLIHATSRLEYNEIRDLGLSNPVAIIPNGIDIPKGIPPDYKISRASKQLLFLSRIHKKKGIENLLEAWKLVQSKHENWSLKVIGKAEDRYDDELKMLAKNLGLVRFDLLDAIYGESKSKEYFDSDLFILPSKSENFGMVIAESLAHGVPVITTKGTPWSKLENNGCGWWVGEDIGSLVSALDEAMGLSDEKRIEMGLKGRQLMEEQFAWDPIGTRMMESYRWLLGKTNKPEYIHLN